MLWKMFSNNALELILFVVELDVEQQTGSKQEK